MTTENIDEELFDGTLGDRAKPWSRQWLTRPDGTRSFESGKAHTAFRLYCEQGDQRSVRSVATALGKSRTLVERWCRRWKWNERAKSFDDLLQERELAANLKERVKMAARQARIAQVGQNIAAQALVDLQRELVDVKDGIPRKRLTPSEVVRLLDVCTKIERVNRGEPEEDQVASIHVHIETQAKPRFAEYADEKQKPEEEYDA